MVQKSVLGTLSFLIYFNDLQNCICYLSQIGLFSDDIAICKFLSNENDVARFPEDLTYLQDREKNWMMQFNSTKCKVLCLTKHHTSVRLTYFVLDQRLYIVLPAKCLGFELSDLCL